MNFLRIWEFYQRLDTVLIHLLTRYREIVSKNNLIPAWSRKEEEN